MNKNEERETSFFTFHNKNKKKAPDANTKINKWQLLLNFQVKASRTVSTDKKNKFSLHIIKYTYIFAFDLHFFTIFASYAL